MAAPSSSTREEACQEVQVAKKEFIVLNSAVREFQTTLGLIVLELHGDIKILEALKMTAVTKRNLCCKAKSDINNAANVRTLFEVLNIENNWVDISLPKQMVEVSRNGEAATLLVEYQNKL